MRSGGLIVGLLLFCVGWRVCGQHGPPRLALGDLLRKNDIPPERLSSAERAQEVKQWMSGREGAKVLLAYSLPEDDGAETTFFHLLRYDPAKPGLEHVRVEPEEECGDQFWQMEPVSGMMALEMSLNPSAGCAILIDERLRVVDQIAGLVAGAAHGQVILYGNMVHFAPTHPQELWIYDPATRKQLTVYPQAGDARRKAFSERLRRVLPPQKWCRENNAACDPKDFTTELSGVTVDPSEMRFRFRATMTASEGFGAKAEQMVKDETLTYVCLWKQGKWVCAAGAGMD